MGRPIGAAVRTGRDVAPTWSVTYGDLRLGRDENGVFTLESALDEGAGVVYVASLDSIERAVAFARAVQAEAEKG